MSKIWVVAAESSGAKIFEADTPLGALRELWSLEHPRGRVFERDLESDRPGRSFDSAGSGRHAMEREVDAKRHALLAFAKQVAAHIEGARAAGAFEQLVLVAGPDFLGLLRQSLSDATKKLVFKEVVKNVVRLGPEAIREQLS